MAYIPSTQIVAPGPIANSATISGSYNNPFTPGSVEYDGYSKAYNISQGVKTGVNNIKNVGEAVASAGKDLVSPSSSGSDLDPNGVDWIGYYESGPSWHNPFGTSASSQNPETPQPYAFMDTSLASMFGMDPATHYQEALANTAYQRQVRDLQAAGLNPVLGISGNGASVFPGTYMPSSSGGSSYGSSGSGKSTSNLAGVAKTLSYSAPYLVGGVVGLVTKNSYAAGLARSATQTLVNLVKYN